MQPRAILISAKVSEDSPVNVSSSVNPAIAKDNADKRHAARMKSAQAKAAYLKAYRKVLCEACARGKLLSKAAAQREARELLGKPRVDRRLDMAHLAALREQGLV